MLIVTKRRYKKRYVIGGAGIFDTVANFVKRLVTSDAAKAIGKTVAIDAGKKLVDKATSRIFSPAAITKKSKDALASLLNEEELETTNINNLLMGRGAIAIQDLVKRLNGAGMKKISY